MSEYVYRVVRVKKPPRATRQCLDCSTDITDRHGNAKRCLACDLAAIRRRERERKRAYRTSGER